MNLDRTIWYMFIIMVILLFAVYFIGLSTDVKAFGAGINQLVLSLTGRNSAGNFAQYPTTPKAA